LAGFAAPIATQTACNSVSVSSINTNGTLGSSYEDVKITVFSAKQYVKDYLERPLKATFPNSTFVEAGLDVETAALAEGSEVALVFVNDVCTREVVARLAQAGVKLIALRCAGFDRVDLEACEKHGIRVVRVPTYAPASVAEHAVALMFALNRNLHIAHLRVLQGNYGLSGLVGYEMNNKTVGVIGTGAIGYEACRILKGIGCTVLAYDVFENPKVKALGIPYLSLEELLPQCHIVSLHCPLLPSTKHIINRDRIATMKEGVMIINVSRGGLIESSALFDALESGRIGALGLDTYEKEGGLFFEDFTIYETSQRMKSWDRQFKSLTTYPQVLVTPHSAFLTKEALDNIATTTINNIVNYATSQPLGPNEVQAAKK